MDASSLWAETNYPYPKQAIIDGVIDKNRTWAVGNANQNLHLHVAHKRRKAGSRKNGKCIRSNKCAKKQQLFVESFLRLQPNRSYHDANLFNSRAKRNRQYLNKKVDNCFNITLASCIPTAYAVIMSRER